MPGFAGGRVRGAAGLHGLVPQARNGIVRQLCRSKQRTFPEIATHNSRQGSVPAMLGSLLVLGLLFTLHPLRLAIIVLLVSRPRPMQNLLSYWAGCLMVCLVTLLVPIIVVYFTPSLASFINDFADPAANPSARYFAIGLGVFALLLAALMAVRFAARPAADRPTSGGKHRLKKRRSVQTSTLVLEPDSPYPIARLLAPSQDEMVEDESLFRRLLRRVRNAWENGSLWVAFVIGLFMGPSVDGALFILAMILASGATIAMQVSGAITFTLAMLAVEEIIFLSNLATPAKTQSFLRWLHDWTRAHHRKALVAIFAVIGLSLIAHGVTGG